MFRAHVVVVVVVIVVAVVVVAAAALVITYLITLCSRFPLEKLTGSQLVKKFPVFYGTRRFITAFTSARYLSLF